MPKINLCFSGWVRGAEITKAYKVKTSNTEEDTIVDVSNMSSEELIQKIENDELSIALADALLDFDDVEIEMFDYEKD